MKMASSQLLKCAKFAKRQSAQHASVQLVIATHVILVTVVVATTVADVAVETVTIAVAVAATTAVVAVSRTVVSVVTMLRATPSQ